MLGSLGPRACIVSDHLATASGHASKRFRAADQFGVGARIDQQVTIETIFLRPRPGCLKVTAYAESKRIAHVFADWLTYGDF